MMHWTRDMQEVNDTDIDEWEVRPIHPPTSLDVEITAYSLMSVIASEGDEAVIKGLPMVKWLSAQRNAYGGFSSTQVQYSCYIKSNLLNTILIQVQYNCYITK